ncbi:hypothetical protein ACFSX9_11845 [Flavobacterium ardleyense]|uniref:MORN repeat variant n=1 Tax=Flavobacterium ardleyense TaxID=2038737 RepID=A0ABW5ZAQ7_9FLAO
MNSIQALQITIKLKHMRTAILISLLFISTVCLGNTIANSSVKLLKFNQHQETDTLTVFQNDETVFTKKSDFVTRPCSRPQLVTYYDLIEPKDGTYYFIYNDKKQLIQEGKYTVRVSTIDEWNKKGAFYDRTVYYYKKNGKLKMTNVQKDGRMFKTEYFNSKKRIKEIKYYDKKSSDTDRIEMYKNGKLKETRVYKSFSTYTTIKAKD